MLTNSLLVLSIVCAVIFGILAATLGDPSIKKAFWVACICSLAVCGILVLFALLGRAGVVVG